MADFTPIYSKKTMDDFGRMLLKMFPKGKLWPLLSSANLFQLCKALSTELLRVEDRMLTLLVERDSRYVSELLDEAERDLGLPDECYPSATTDDERRARVRQKLINSGGIHEQDYINAAEDFGFTIDITTYEPFICGLHGMGHSIGDNENFFIWQVGADYTESTIASLKGMVCLFDRVRPAHTIIQWLISNVPSVVATLDHTKLLSDMSQFPLMIELDTTNPGMPSDFFTNKIAEDYYYLYAKIGDTSLNVDVSRFDLTNNKMYIHVSSSSVDLSSLTDTEISVFFGLEVNDLLALSGGTAAQLVYDDDYSAVYNMNQIPSSTSGAILDSSQNDVNGTCKGSMTSANQVETETGYGISFNGTDQGIDFGDNFDDTFGSDTANSTFEIAFNLDMIGSEDEILFAKHDSTSGNKGIQIGINNNELVHPPGDTWSGYTSAENNNIFAVNAGGSTYIAVAGNGTYRVQRSTNAGQSWTGITSGVGSYNWQAVDYSPTLDIWVAVSADGYIMYSDDDGLTWTTIAAPELNNWSGVCWSSHLAKFVAVAQTGTNRIMYSSDGINWSVTSAPVANTWVGIHSANNLIVAVAYSGSSNRVMYCTSSVTSWTSVSVTSNSWNDVTYDASLDLWAACSWDGTYRVMTSSDPTSLWTDRSTYGLNPFVGVTSGAGRFCIVSDNGGLEISDDGINWTQKSPPESGNKWNDACYGPDDNIFVSVAYSNSYRIMVSDGSTEYIPKLFFDYQNQAGTMQRRILSSVNLSEDTDYHAVVTYDATIDTNDGLDRVEIWIDGAKDTSTILETSTGVLGDCDGNAAHAGIAGIFDTTGELISNPFNGIIDLVRISNVKRSDNYIDALYKNYSKQLISFSEEDIDLQF